MNLVRSEEEIKDLISELQEHKELGSDFMLLTFEEGALSVIKWLFFQSSPLPTDWAYQEIEEKDT